MSDSVVVMGAGGHASVLMDILQQNQCSILAIVSPRMLGNSERYRGVPCLESDDDVLAFDKNTVSLVNGIGGPPGQIARWKLFSRFSEAGYKFPAVVSRYAHVSPFATLGSGVQVMAGAIVQAGAFVGENTIVNTGAIIDHDCSVGVNNHIAPGAVLCGGVTTAENVFIGASATVIQQTCIAHSAVVGAGAVVIRGVEENERYLGFG